MTHGILDQLKALNIAAEQARTRKEFQHLANDLQLDLESTPEAKIQVILDEMWRRFKYAPDPMREFNRAPFVEGEHIDVDDACRFEQMIIGPEVVAS